MVESQPSKLLVAGSSPVSRSRIGDRQHRGWPEAGVIAECALDAPGWVRAEVDLRLVAQSRADGAVLPFAHWPEQAAQAAQVTVARETPAQT